MELEFDAQTDASKLRAPLEPIVDKAYSIEVKPDAPHSAPTPRGPQYKFEDTYDQWTNAERPGTVFVEEE